MWLIMREKEIGLLSLALESRSEKREQNSKTINMNIQPIVYCISQTYIQRTWNLATIDVGYKLMNSVIVL